MADQTIFILDPITVQSSTDIKEVSLNGAGSRKESRAQELDYMSANVQLPSTEKVTGLDDILVDKASLTVDNEFKAKNTYLGQSQFENQADFLDDANFYGVTSLNGQSYVYQILNTLLFRTALTSALTATSGTLTATQVLGGGIYFNTTGGVDSAWQFPTGDAIEQEFSFFSPANDESFFLALINQSTSGTVTFSVNTHLTFDGLTIPATFQLPPLSYALIRCVKIDNTPTYTLVGASYGYGNFSYEKYVHNTTWSGIWASPQTGNLTLFKQGNEVRAYLPLVTSTASIAALITMDTLLPARFRPAAEAHIFIPIQNNTAFSSFGGTKILTTGGITVSASVSFGGNFTASGTGGIYGGTPISWLV